MNSTCSLPPLTTQDPQKCWLLTLGFDNRNILSWYEGPTNHDYIEGVDKKAQKIARVGEEEKDFVSYTNTCRDGPLEWRYKGQDRIARLRALKKQWGPSGIFTQELL